MARIIANHIVLHGNKNIKWLEKEIFIRIYKDSKKFGESRKSLGVKRIFFGLNDDQDFDWEKEIGSPWAYFQKQDGKDAIIFISPYPPIFALQDYITLHAAKLDPNVVIQLEYEDISGAVIGTRLTTLGLDDCVNEFKAHKFSPLADDRELSRSAMNRVRQSQRSTVLRQIVKKHGAEYALLDLNIFSHS